ncbi:zinc knuckle CX2CX4HX4C containing protein, partial [Tanacetum coccineum]
DPVTLNNAPKVPQVSSQTFVAIVSPVSTNQKVNFRVLKTSLPKKSNFDVGIPITSIEEKSTMNENNFFFFKLSSAKGVDDVLQNRPWMIGGSPVILNKWNPSIYLTKEDLLKVPIWVKFRDVPITAFTQDGLSMIATESGMPMMLDSFANTMCLYSWVRSSYARAMIEVC